MKAWIQTKTPLIYGTMIFVCLLPFMSPLIALLIGVAFSLSGITYKPYTRYTSFILQAAIVLMGFGMNLSQAIKASGHGFVDTAISVTTVVTVGLLLGKLFKVDSKTTLLIASGTAICGGSAIAAVAPVIDAKNHQISFALAVIFILNAVALIIFPLIGHYFHLSQETFGYWAAIAIHDTSSVVGAGATYGPKALEIATTVKLIRALWIIPLSIVIILFRKDKNTNKIKIPWFIGLFILSVIAAYLIPSWHEAFGHLSWLGKKGMVIALFFIGSGMSISEAKKAGAKSFALGILLWMLIGISSFMMLTR